MGTYPNGKPRIFVASTEASTPHLAWVHRRNYFSATKIGLNTFQETHTHPKPGLAAVPIRSVPPRTEPNPIRSVPPRTEPATNSEFETNPTNVKKKKPSAASSSQDASEVLRPNKLKKTPSDSTNTGGQIKPGANSERINLNLNVERNNLNTVLNEANSDFSDVPPPYCSCTGVRRGCYKWGAGGWQSICCNTSISTYPLPKSSSRPGRVAGRKMSTGAYRKLLCKLAAEGHDLSHPVDLKNHWAKHGTNKFVTIK